MDIDKFDAGVRSLQKHIEDLQRQVAQGPTPQSTLLQVAFETMHSTLEELRVAEEEMRAQNEALVAAFETAEIWRHYYKDLFEFAPDSYLVTDLDGIIREANQSAAQLLGMMPRFLIGKPLAGFIADENRRAFRIFLSDLAQTRQPQEWETWLKPRRGPILDVLLAVVVVSDPQGQPTGLRWLARDLSQRSQAEAERYRLMVEEIVDYAIFLMDREGRVLTWNGAAERILGYTQAEMIGQTSERIFTPEDQAQGAPAQELAAAAAQGRAEDERWHQRKDGTRFFASGVVTALRDSSGNLRWYAKVLRDFTERKQNEERLAASYAREHRIAETFQRALLPELPPNSFPGLEFAALYQAAWAEAQVGGDFYDIFALDAGRVALVVGDVSGKGLTAAARTAESKYALRAFLHEDPDPARALTRLNAFAYESHRHTQDQDLALVSLSVLVLAPRTGEAALAVAGAEPPLLLRADGGGESLPAAGRLLGVEISESYQSVSLTLAPGDTVLMVTDGITEARHGGEFLEYEGMARLADEHRANPSLQSMGQAILDGARAFAHGSLADDACLLLARRTAA